MSSNKSSLLAAARELKILQAERMNRQKAREDLLTYASSIEIPGAPTTIEEEGPDHIGPVLKNFGSHHLLWLGALQQVADGKIKRLMGLMPPGSGKSIYTSVVF